MQLVRVESVVKFPHAPSEALQFSVSGQASPHLSGLGAGCANHAQNVARIKNVKLLAFSSLEAEGQRPFLPLSLGWEILPRFF